MFLVRCAYRESQWFLLHHHRSSTRLERRPEHGTLTGARRVWRARGEESRLKALRKPLVWAAGGMLVVVADDVDEEERRGVAEPTCSVLVAVCHAPR